MLRPAPGRWRSLGKSQAPGGVFFLASNGNRLPAESAKMGARKRRSLPGTSERSQSSRSVTSFGSRVARTSVGELRIGHDPWVKQGIVMQFVARPHRVARG